MWILGTPTRTLLLVPECYSVNTTVRRRFQYFACCRRKAEQFFLEVSVSTQFGDERHEFEVTEDESIEIMDSLRQQRILLQQEKLQPANFMEPQPVEKQQTVSDIPVKSVLLESDDEDDEEYETDDE